MRLSVIVFFLLFPIVSNSQEVPDDTADLCTLLAHLKKQDQLYRKELSTLINEKGSRETIDSLWQLQIVLDNSNTEKLIQLTKKHGWLSKERLQCDFDPLVFLIFRHSQNNYFDEIKPLIDQALSAEYINRFHYEIVDDHLQGRPKY